MKYKPYSEDVESALIAACLVNNEALSIAIERIQDDHFYVRNHPRIWNAITKLYNSGKEITSTSVASFFSDEELTKYIQEISAFCIDSSPKQIDILIERLIELWQRRTLIWKLEETLTELESEDPDDRANEVIEELDAFLYKLNSEEDIKGPNLNGMQDAIEAINRAMKNGGVVGVSTGFKEIDKILGGFAKQDLIIIAGRPSMGKTSLALCMAEKIQEKEPVLFCSLEMSAEQISCKRLSLRTNIPATKMREGSLSQAEVNTIIASQNPGQLWIDDQAAISPDQLLSRARRLKKQYGLGAIVVDYLQLMSASRDAQRQGSVQATTEISKRLKGIAKDLDVPVIALSQLSRALESRESKRPMLSDLRESGSIEQDADSVMFVYRDEYYLERNYPEKFNKESDENYSKRLNTYHERLNEAKGKAEVIVAKNRHGRIDTAVMEFIGETTKFTDLEDRLT